MNYMKNLFKNKKITEIIKYIIAGILTTCVSYSVYWFLCYVVKLNPNISNIISIICSVLFAYIINKIFVFNSITNNFKKLILEVIAFVFSRSFTIIIEIGGIFLLVTIFKYDAMYSKILISIIIILLNYIISTCFVFNSNS